MVKGHPLPQHRSTSTHPVCVQDPDDLTLIVHVFGCVRITIPLTNKIVQQVSRVGSRMEEKQKGNSCPGGPRNGDFHGHNLMVVTGEFWLQPPVEKSLRWSRVWLWGSSVLLLQSTQSSMVPGWVNLTYSAGFNTRAPWGIRWKRELWHWSFLHEKSFGTTHVLSCFAVWCVWVYKNGLS